MSKTIEILDCAECTHGSGAHGFTDSDSCNIISARHLELLDSRFCDRHDVSALAHEIDRAASLHAETRRQLAVAVAALERIAAKGDANAPLAVATLDAIDALAEIRSKT